MTSGYHHQDTKAQINQFLWAATEADLILPSPLVSRCLGGEYPEWGHG
jgi:hypothetical protein